MASDLYEQRKKLTFAQAEGAEPLPQQLAIGEVSQELRAKLWSVIYASILHYREAEYGSWYLGSPWLEILRRKHVVRDFKMADEFDPHFDSSIKELKAIFTRGNYVAVFDLVQWLLSQNDCPVRAPLIRSILASSRAAYRLLDDDKTIVPVSSDEEALTINRAFVDLRAVEFNGARAHLLAAAKNLTSGAPSDSIRESIHAIESVARAIGGTNSLSQALQKIRSESGLHPALERGFNSIYGFTSDEKGIRHPLIDDGTAKVDEIDAIFMIGACAAFVSYLVNRSREKQKA